MKRISRSFTLWAVAVFIRVSTLSGQSVWTPLASQYRSGSTGLVPDPGDPTAIYLSTPQGIVRYNQSTQTSVVLPGSQMLGGIGVSPSNPQILYGFTGLPLGNGALLKSPDGGQTWTETSSSLPTLLTPPVFLFGTVVDPNDSSVLYAIFGSPGPAYYGLFRSADGGKSWALIRPPNNELLPTLAISVGTPATLFLLSVLCCSPPEYVYNRLVRTSDGGATWTEATVPVNNQSVGVTNGLLTDPRSPSTVYLYGGKYLASIWEAVGPR